MLFCCLWRNVESSCHKRFVVVSRHQQTLPLITNDKCHKLRDRGPAARGDNTWPVAALTARSEARYRLRIAISAYPTCIRRSRYGGGGSRRNIVLPFSMEKLQRLGYPMVKKNLKICLFVSTEFTNVTHTHTHTQRK